MRSAATILLALVFATGARAQDTAEVQQISDPAQADTSTDQVQHTPEASMEQTSQLSSAAPSAQPPQPLSRPEEGRTAAVAKVEGKDRCDVGNPAHSKSDQCKHVIETRAADYMRPAPAELSPEQKLLIDQQALNSTNAGDRLAKSGDPDNSLDAMGIASIVLTQSQPEEPKKREPDPQSDAAIQAIINVITSQPPQ